MPVISIQSTVAFDPVGNSAAVFAMQRLGVEVWPVHTVQLSNHTGYPDWGGGALGAQHVGDVLDGLERRGAFASADALLSGYAGAAELIAVIAGAVDRMKTANPTALYCCDPVIGNAAKGLFVADDVAQALKTHLLGRADIATPNRFELGWLTGQPADTLDQARAAADVLAASGPNRIVVTSVPSDVGLGVLVRDKDAAWLIETPKLVVSGNGAGDCMTAMMIAHLIQGVPFENAVAQAVSSVFGLLSRGEAGELAMISAQDEIVAPHRVFEAKRLS